MVKRWLNTIALLIALLPWPAHALLTIEITGGSEAALPIAIVPFGSEGYAAPEDISAIISNDLASSGRFAPLEKRDLISQPHEAQQVNFADWRLLRSEGLLIGKVSSQDGENFQVQFQLFDVYKGQQLVGKRYKIPASGLRNLAHQIADIVYETLTGEKGVFSTRLAFVTEMKNADGSKRYALQVSDADGANPRTVLQSTQPIMSPNWAPDGERLTYVSFENGNSEVYVQELRSGRRNSIASFKGLNSAPAWSPDGKKLALTLSKGGNPEIYVLELDSGKLSRVTHNSQAIDTEAVWMPNGREILFTSDRGGRPQIYKVAATGGRAERLTFEGGYNASADISPDGRMMSMVHAVNGKFHIAVQDLQTGAVQVLTDTTADESPSFAPNGRMILYATSQKGKGVLAAVSVDGQIKQRLGESGSAVREPAWSPFRN
ncbi:Tol-Pal system beta propeller repeat protein TolB [Methylophaga sp. OBS4]|uniref:Tol-Pal system beta propeller repeat protein TolB n=1 Tax=Methylophaga sp. OBS4 TaxID=2991935 RepID=UPI00224FEEA4|nr:Tol-Pal system beta propeller repeat protein TolB [Methylophaga sp. OBS4]MCX4186339.1 Tol-Pal system beta propeller repeat protein TolB [Methylophaga sp. OBS4]